MPVFMDKLVTSGSLGGGIVIGEGVRSVVSEAHKSSVEVWQTDPVGVPSLVSNTSDVIMTLLEKMDVNARIQTYSHLPSGCGYGMSAAALLSTAYAVNKLYDLGMNPEKCTLFAHETEILHKSGLGDVSACQGGGFVVRKTPGPFGEITRRQDTRPIYAVTQSSVSTSEILSSDGAMERIKMAFPDEVPLTLEDLFRVSRKFAERSGLISDEVRQILSVCDENNIPASMTMLGNGIFALGRVAQSVLKPFGNVFRLNISTGGPRILTGEKI